MPNLKTLDQVAELYAFLVKAKERGIQAVDIDSTIELVDCLGKTMADMLAYKLFSELLEKDMKKEDVRYHVH